MRLTVWGTIKAREVGGHGVEQPAEKKAELVKVEDAEFKFVKDAAKRAVALQLVHGELVGIA